VGRETSHVPGTVRTVWGLFDNWRCSRVRFVSTKRHVQLNQFGDIKIEEATTASQLSSIRELFLEYAASLEISLCFQNFEEELSSLPGKYAPPHGRLLLASDLSQAVGCAAVRALEPGICEMKRLYVRPAGRRHGLGRTLAVAIIEAARQFGYARMRLDTLASMTPAIMLYHSLGFCRIPAYYANPSDNVVFMELQLNRTVELPGRAAGQIIR